MEITTHKECLHARRGIQDMLQVINGKWKSLILITLFQKPYRFKELAREIGISPRMLSRELQDLEMNKLITRTVYETKPVTIEYAITKTGLTLGNVLGEMAKWGVDYRKKMLAK